MYTYWYITPPSAIIYFTPAVPLVAQKKSLIRPPIVQLFGVLLFYVFVLCFVLLVVNLCTIKNLSIYLYDTILSLLCYYHRYRSFNSTSNRKKELLMLDGYTFWQKNYTVFWYCSRRSMGCPAKIKRCDGGSLERVQCVHNHDRPQYMFVNGQYIKI